MENYLGLIISVENYHDAKRLGKVNFALNDGQVIKDTFIKLGCSNENMEFLSDNLATRTTILQKVQEISSYAKSTDVIIFYYAGHGFYHNGKNLISCVDTNPSSLSETTIELNFILSAFDKSECGKVIVFLDCCHSGIEFTEGERSPVSSFSSDDLKYEYSNAEHLTVFASCKSNEKSQADFKRSHGAWTYYLIQALSGNAKGIYTNNLLFSDALQKFLHEATFTRVKEITVEKKNQTPIKYGKETKEKFIIADLSQVFEKRVAKETAEAIRFENATVLSKEDDWVKNLPGFKEGNKAPKEVSNYYENWIQKISSKMLEEELNEIATLLRQRLSYKRKDIQEAVVDGGAGQLSTVDFDYILKVTQSRNKPEKYLLTRSIENFKNSEILSNPDFNEIFTDYFDELEFQTNKRIKIADIIDKIEDIDDPDSIAVKYDQTDLSKCEIICRGFLGRIVLTEETFRIVVEKKQSPERLILSCQQVYETLKLQGVPKMIE